MASDSPSISALQQFTVDFTAMARDGQLDPIVERETEIAQLMGILLRRRQNNPILVGEPGVGKTAIVEGFALRIASGNVPPILQSVTLRSLDIGSLLAGAAVRGEFETRLKAVIKEVESASGMIILFIDEAHMLIGTGGQADAANLLKPALARGTLRTIAATTYAEYRKYFEKDPAFARRFELLTVAEPSEDAAIRMLRPLVPHLERHHGVTIANEAIEAAVRLSSRFISGRQLPDKAVSVLDTSCARVSSAQTCMPLAVAKAQQRVARIEEEIRLLERETVSENQDDLSAAFDRLASAETHFADLEDRWREEMKLVGELLRCKIEAESAQADKADLTSGLSLHRASEQLKTIAGEAPLVPAFVDNQVVAAVIAEQTGIPAGQLQQNELHTLLILPRLLGDRILGQEQALSLISKRLLSIRTGLTDSNKPAGVFLLAGPSGVGKTETCLAVADLLYGGEQNALILNMAEFREPHSISVLKGAPPGYVGYGETGLLTEAIRRRPYTLIVLEDIDQAHRDVSALLTQAFGKGGMEDAQGRSVSFRHALIMMTTNAVNKQLTDSFRDSAFDVPQWRQELTSFVPSALLDLASLVPFYPLTRATIGYIAELKLNSLASRTFALHQVQIEIDDLVTDLISSEAANTGLGARAIDNVLRARVLPEVSSAILNAKASERRLQKIILTTGADQAIKPVCR